MTLAVLVSAVAVLEAAALLVMALGACAWLVGRGSREQAVACVIRHRGTGRPAATVYAFPPRAGIESAPAGLGRE